MLCFWCLHSKNSRTFQCTQLQAASESGFQNDEFGIMDQDVILLSCSLKCSPPRILMCNMFLDLSLFHVLFILQTGLCLAFPTLYRFSLFLLLLLLILPNLVLSTCHSNSIADLFIVDLSLLICTPTLTYTSLLHASSFCYLESLAFGFVYKARRTIVL